MSTPLLKLRVVAMACTGRHLSRHESRTRGSKPAWNAGPASAWTVLGELCAELAQGEGRVDKLPQTVGRLEPKGECWETDYCAWFKNPARGVEGAPRVQVGVCTVCPAALSSSANAMTARVSQWAWLNAESAIPEPYPRQTRCGCAPLALLREPPARRTSGCSALRLERVGPRSRASAARRPRQRESS